jgi:hypothetical protein
LQGLEWCLQKEVHILNLSLGITGYRPAFIKLIQTIRENGILPIVAIGNEGQGISRSPGNYRECLSVGAVDNNKHSIL